MRLALSQRRPQRAPLAHSTMRGHRKKTVICEPESNTKLASTLTLDFPASRTMLNKCSLFTPPILWYFARAASGD